MRDVSQQCRDVLASGVFSVEWVADLYYDGDPKAQNLGVLDPKFAWDMSAQIQGSGSCQILWDDLFGQSVVPREIGDLFSPFGAELQVDVIVSAGGFSERVPMGRFVLDAVPDSVEYAIANANPPKSKVFGPWVEARRNLIPRPVPVDASDWYFSGGTRALDSVFTRRPGVPTLRNTLTSTQSNYVSNALMLAPGLASLTDAIPVTAGETYTVSAYASASMAGYRSRFQLSWADSSGAPVASIQGPYATGGVVGGWQRPSFTAVAPVGAAYVAPAVTVSPSSGTVPAGSQGWVTDGMLEVGSTVGEFIAPGVIPNTDTHRIVWTGAPNASASVEQSREVQMVTGHAEPVIVESRVSLDLSDYFLRIARDSFPFPTSPQSTSMWDEAQRLTGLAVVRSIDDRALPTNIAYDEDRLEALGKVFGPSNAWPTLTPDGALTARPKDWPEPVDRLETVLDAPLVMRSENVYNRVVVEGKNPDPDGPALRAVLEVTDGFLRTQNADGARSPFGGNTYTYSSEFLVTQAQCQQYASELLPRVSRIRSVTRKVTEPFNPLREVGDVLVLVDPTRMNDESLVRIRSIDHNESTTTLEVEVSE